LHEDSFDPRGEFQDEIRRQVGLVQYWMFLNGDSVRLFAALASASFGVLCCFLSILGIAKSFWRAVVAVLAVISFVVLTHRRYATPQIRAERLAEWRDPARTREKRNSSRHHFVAIHTDIFRHSNLCSVVA